MKRKTIVLSVSTLIFISGILYQALKLEQSININTAMKNVMAVNSKVVIKKGTRLIDNLKCLGSSKQAIIVVSNSAKDIKVSVSTYEKINDVWTEILYNIPGVIGEAGFSVNRKQGDRTSPIGAFHFISLFGWGVNPGFKMPFRPAGKNDYWVSNNVPEEYNVWIHYEGNPKKRFQSYEALGYIDLYKYGAIMDFNYGKNKVVGKGSGIFLHQWRSPNKGTEGCTAVASDKLLQILMWMDPKKDPVIIQGPKSELENQF